MFGLGLAEVLVLAVLGGLAAVVALVVVIVLVRRGRGAATPLERIHRDYRQLTLAERQALLEFIQSDLRGHP
jgi:hypothetical protein